MTEKPPVLTSADGMTPLKSAVRITGEGAATHAVPPYSAADANSQELSQWFPQLFSADRDYLDSRDAIVARIRDLARNSGWASSAITRYLDSVIGIGFRPSVKPNWRALGLDREWASDWGDEVEAKWDVFAENPDDIDAAETDDFSGLLRLSFREWLISGEALVLPLWLTDKMRSTTAATAFQVVDTDRLSNPNFLPDDEYLRGGVELNRYGAPVAYHIRRAHPGDFPLSAARAWEWERIARNTSWGRRRVIHAMEKTRPGQTRGVSRLAPIVERVKMLDRYDKTELQAAVLNAVLAMFIESPFDEDLADALDSGSGLAGYQEARTEFHKTKKIKLNGVTIPTLFPGEKLSFQTAARPNTAFADFERACLRNIAAGIGLTYEQLTMDWSQVNYSSARAAIQEIWKTFSADRQLFAHRVATPIFMLWLEEQIQTGKIKTPPRAPDFYDAKSAYCHVKWIGAGRGYVDPEKEAKAANMRIKTGISTLEDECAEQGKDWKEVLEQQAEERRFAADNGIDINDWAALQPSGGETPRD